MTERDEAITIANRVLDNPHIDPDGEICTLARQFLAEVERRDMFIARLKDAPLSAFNSAVSAGWEGAIDGHEESERKRGRWLFGAMLDDVVVHLQKEPGDAA